MYTDECSNDNRRMDCVNDTDEKNNKINVISHNVDDVKINNRSQDDDDDSNDVISADARTDSRNDNNNEIDDDDGMNLFYSYKTLLDDIDYQQFIIKNRLFEQQLYSNNNDHTDENNNDNATDNNNDNTDNNNNNSNNYDNNTDSIIIMKMTISYELPDIVAFLLKGMGSIATDFIDKTLTNDLERFNEILKSKYEVM